MTQNNTLTKEDLQALGYEFTNDSELTGMIFWKNDNVTSKGSFSTEEQAIADASADAFNTYNLHRCDNCGKVHSDETLVEAKDLAQRVDAGGVMPSGECADCGALCYPLEAPRDLVKMRLVVNVEYNLNGEEPDEMTSNLDRLVERAIGDGLLTGGSSAEVESYDYEVEVLEDKPFDDLQQLVLKHYNDGDHLVETPGDVQSCGDGLLKFVLIELSRAEGCDNHEVAVQRLDSSIRKLQRLAGEISLAELKGA